MKKSALTFIRWYQKNQPLRKIIGSHFLLFGGDCKFVPTCSEYMYTAIEKYGAIKGVFWGMWRLLRCNPFSKGGIDRL